MPFTRKAFQIIPHIDEPLIADIGCGTGVVTLELAALSNGSVIGIDIDRIALGRLEQRIKKAGLGGRVKAVNCSMSDLKFDANSLDIMWSEGAIFVVGFEGGLKLWRCFIRPGGFLVVHARIIEIEKRTGMIPELGYHLFNKFIVPKEAWCDLYYGPLETHVELLKQQRGHDVRSMASLNTIQEEIDEFKRNPEYHGSVFYICRKTGGG